MCKFKRMFERWAMPRSEFTGGVCLDDLHNLSILEKLTPKLPTFPSAIGGAEGYKEYKMSKGKCEAWDILNTPAFSLTRWHNSKGSRFPRHNHEQTEIIIITSGKLDIKYNTKGRKTIKEGETVYNKPGEYHSGHFIEDTWYITVMIPAADYYPHKEKIV